MADWSLALRVELVALLIAFAAVVYLSIDR